MNNELLAKRLELLYQAVPRAARFALLIDSTLNRNAPDLVRELQSAASAFGIQLEILIVSSANAVSSELDSAFDTMMQKRVEALIVAPGPLSRDSYVVALASRYGMPAIYAYRWTAAAGGLMSYGAKIGADNNSVLRIMGTYVGRILKGEKAGDLPVQRSTNFDFVINLQTARALGLTLPPTLLALADEVIE